MKFLLCGARQLMENNQEKLESENDSFHIPFPIYLPLFLIE
jgi:hypothetical protein